MMNDVLQPLQELPPEVLVGNEHANFDPPTEWRVYRSDGRDLPWYETFIDGSSFPDAVMFSFRGKTRHLTRDEVTRLLYFQTIVSSPLLLMALPLRLCDRILRFARVLPPLEYMASLTPVENALSTLIDIAIRFGEVHVERSGQVLLGHERRSGPCIHKPALAAMRRIFLRYPAETANVEVGHWGVRIYSPMGDAISLVAMPIIDSLA
jgi:hypothetical protein